MCQSIHSAHNKKQGLKITRHVIRDRDGLDDGHGL
jgi:hypothetical protein